MPNATLPSCRIISNFIRRVAFNVFCSCIKEVERAK